MEWRWVEAARCGREGINLQGENHVSAISVNGGGQGRAGCGNSFSSDGGREGKREEGERETRGEGEEREACYRSRLPLASPGSKAL